MQQKIVDIIRDCQKRGGTVEQIGEAAGISRRGIYRKMKEESFTEREAIRVLRAAGMRRTADAMQEILDDKNNQLEELLCASVK